MDEFDQEKEAESDFFGVRIETVRKVKSERKGVKRNTLSKIVSGKAVTEKEVADEVRKHVSEQNGKKGSRRSKKGSEGENVEKDSISSESKVNKGKGKACGKGKGKACRKGKSKAVKSKVSKKNDFDSQKPGPSAFYISDSDMETDSESEIKEEDKCCVCKKFTPDDVRNSVQLMFTNWVQCTCGTCNHWVHLGICTTVRVVRLGDTFNCIHCA